MPEIEVIEEKVQTLKVTISAGQEQKVRLYQGGTRETFLSFLQTFQRLLEKKGLLKKHQGYTREWKLAKREAESHATQKPDTRYVAADLSVETSDHAYATTRSLALVLLCTYVPLFPCCVFGALYRYRHHLRSEEAISRAPAWVRQTGGRSRRATRVGRTHSPTRPDPAARSPA